MGWSFSYDWTRKSLIEHLTENWNDKQHRTEKGMDFYLGDNKLKHCYRGNAYSGVLWVVWERYKKNVEDDSLIEQYRWIGCYLVKCYKAKGGLVEWGYKDMCESMGPCYYSCPLGYLDMVKHEPNEKWREGVREYHDRRKLKFKPVVGMVLKMRERVTPDYVKITSVKPLLGVDKFGGRWRITKKCVLEPVADFPAQ